MKARVQNREQNKKSFRRKRKCRKAASFLKKFILREMTWHFIYKTRVEKSTKERDVSIEEFKAVATRR